MKQERWKSILKPLTILPVIVMLCTIFGFSNQNGTTSGGLSQKVSRQIVTVCDTLFHQDLAEETSNIIPKKSNILCAKQPTPRNT